MYRRVPLQDVRRGIEVPVRQKDTFRWAGGPAAERRQQNVVFSDVFIAKRSVLFAVCAVKRPRVNSEKRYLKWSLCSECTRKNVVPLSRRKWASAALNDR